MAIMPVRRGSAGLLILGGLVICSLAGELEAARSVQPLGKDWQRGAIVSVRGRDAYRDPATDESIAALAATGSTHVGLYPEWFMDSSESSHVGPDRDRTPSDGSVLHAMNEARSHGMSISLTPVVRPPGWQGTIVPRRTDKWFRDYREMVGHYAELAERGRAESLVVGAELRSMVDHTSEWKRVIEVARKRFDGDLMYSALPINEAERIDFWKHLDQIGISAYMSLVRDEPNPSVKELVEAWKRRWVGEITRLKRKHDRPVVFTEVGYGSREGTAASPWAVPTGPISQEAQRRPYEALYRVWSRYRWFKGVYWWYWPVGAYDPSNGTHSPRGKAAEQTMRDWNTAR